MQQNSLNRLKTPANPDNPMSIESGNESLTGVIMLNTCFPRFAGDIGNPASINGLSLYEKVPLATVGKIVTGDGIEESVAQSLLEAAERLGEASVDVIVTSCGYLGELQDALQRAAGVPLISTSLVVLPMLRALYGDAARIGVMTFDATRLKPHHLQLQKKVSGRVDAVDHNIVVRGMETTEAFYTMIAEDKPDADFDQLQREVLEVARTFDGAGTKALILECTNLSPYRREIQAVVKVPVFDLHDVLRFFRTGV